MTTINLRAAEARQLLDAGRCEVVRVMRPQPDDEVVDEGPYWYVGGFRLRESAANPLPYPLPAPGEVVACREPINRPHCDTWLYSADHQPVMVNATNVTAMIVWAHHKQQDQCTARSCPAWAIRLHARVESRGAEVRDGKWCWVAWLVKTEKGGE